MREKKPFPGPRSRDWGTDELLDDSARLARSWGTRGAIFEVCRRLNRPALLFLGYNFKATLAQAPATRLAFRKANFTLNS
jgi:hypothetical protein